MRKVPAENALKGIGISLVVLYVILTIYHLSNGFDFGSALAGPFLDTRAFFMCWNDWGQLSEFISRPAVLGDDLGGVALDLGMCR